jgi:hypothetical protein
MSPVQSSAKTSDDAVGPAKQKRFTASPKTATQEAPPPEDRRVPVPEGMENDLGMGFISERDEFIHLYAPECLDKVNKDGQRIGHTSEYVAFYGDPNEPKGFYERRGYEPVKDDDGNVVNHRGDPLFRIPRKVRDARRAVPARRSMETVATHNMGEDRAAKEEGFHRENE